METPGLRSWVGVGFKVDPRAPPGFVASAFLCDLSLGHGAGTLTKGRQGVHLPRPKQASAEPAEELEGYCLSGSIALSGSRLAYNLADSPTHSRFGWICSSDVGAVIWEGVSPA